ncbi:MAG: nuclear transport factor 2 family protein [Candidatus Bathyarchaeia archaeon]
MEDRKNIIAEYFKLIGSGKFKDGLRFFAPECKTHNPFVVGDMSALFDAMIAANKDYSPKYPEAQFAVRYLLAYGDFVVAHTQLMAFPSKPSEGGLRQMHLFRFEGDKIGESWDITQQIMPNMPNAAGSF